MKTVARWHHLGSAVLYLALTGCAGDDGAGSGVDAGTSPVTCGDGVCTSGENTANCELDCPASGPYCGDGMCSYGESSANCSPDCAAPAPSCGDGTCNGTEDETSCPGDCQPAPQACTTSPDSCTGDTICINGTCAVAFPRIYRITNVAVTVPMTNPASGDAWDVGGGAPDPFLKSNSIVLAPAVDDTYTATFAGPFELQLVSGGALRLEVWDEDLSSDDFMFLCEDAPVRAELLRARAFTCAVNGFSVSAQINPK